MTAFHRENIKCPHCLNEEEIVIWDSIDANEDPDLKERILLKEIQDFECQNCNHRYILEKPFLFIDRKEEIIFYFNPEHRNLPQLKLREANGALASDIRSLLPSDFGFNTDDYTLRLVLRYNELIEKIHIHDNALLDRLVEVVKLAIAANIANEMADEPSELEQAELNSSNEQIGDLYFVGTDNDRYIFQVLTPDYQWQQLELEQSVYVQAYTMMAQYLPQEGEWDIVDRHGAELFSQYVAEQLTQ